MKKDMVEKALPCLNGCLAWPAYLRPATGIQHDVTCPASYREAVLSAIEILEQDAEKRGAENKKREIIALFPTSHIADVIKRNS